MIDAFLGTRWSQPRTEASQESSAGQDEDAEDQRCQPRSLLFYPHRAFALLLRQLKRHSTAVRWLVFVLWVAYVAYALVYNFYIVKNEYDWCHQGGLISWTSVVILAYLVTSKVIIPYAHHLHSLQAELHNRVIAFLGRLFSRR